MIDFPCQCGYRFQVPEDRAGGLLQCPDCRRLNEIPRLSELASFEPDGTYVIDRAPPPTSHLAGTRRGDLGDAAADLRRSPEDFDNVGVPLDPVTPATKYDPETGDVIQPMEVTPSSARPLITLAPTSRRPRDAKSLTYATGDLAHHVSPCGVLIELFTPANAMVMVFIFIFHLVMQIPMLFHSVYLPAAGTATIAIFILAHYGCVIEDIGPDGNDELPRPLRGMALGEDILGPASRIIFALMFAYAPAAIAYFRLEHNPISYFIAGSLAAAGTVLFPMICLTTTTSGTWHNLRPDRLLGSITVAGAIYPLMVVEWVIVLAFYGGGIAVLHHYVSPFIDPSAHIVRWKVMLSMAALSAGIYCAHLFCWHLGHLYRLRSEGFPWIMQRHVKMNRPSPAVRPGRTPTVIQRQTNR